MVCSTPSPQKPIEPSILVIKSVVNVVRNQRDQRRLYHWSDRKYWLNHIAGITFPPETEIYCPEINPARSEARNATRLATSWSVPRRLSGTCWMYASSLF